MMCLALVLLPAASGQRATNWVIRASNLAETLAFMHDVLGMKTLRHEEHDEADPATANGGYDTRWSKTVVGYGGAEGASYALEVTYNYGVASYERGSGLQRFVLVESNPNVHAERTAAAARLGFRVRRWDAPSLLQMGDLHATEEAAVRAAKPMTGFTGAAPRTTVITGPDGYVYELRGAQQNKGRAERFHSVVLKAANANLLADWYVRYLKMETYPAVGQANGARMVGYDDADGREAVRFVIEQISQLGDRKPNVTAWEGRSALALPEADVRAINDRLIADAWGGHAIVHELHEHEERHGTLVAVVVHDPAGYEIALVSAEAYEPSAAAAIDGSEPDWAQRGTYLDTVLAASAATHDEL